MNHIPMLTSTSSCSGTSGRFPMASLLMSGCTSLSPSSSSQTSSPSTGSVRCIISSLTVDWWPKSLGGKTSYALSWSTTIIAGLLAHHFDLFRMRERWHDRDKDEVDWERKSAFTAIPALTQPSGYRSASSLCSCLPSRAFPSSNATSDTHIAMPHRSPSHPSLTPALVSPSHAGSLRPGVASCGS
jgi:hypothetical protein